MFGLVWGFPIQHSSFWFRFLVFRFRILCFGSDFGFSDLGFKFVGPDAGFSDSGFRFLDVIVWLPMQDSGFWVRCWVFRLRIQVCGCDFGVSDSGFNFVVVIVGFPIQDSSFWLPFWIF